MSWQQKVSDLEWLADQTLEIKRSHFKARPFMIEFLGAPKSGKSRHIDALANFLTRQNYIVKIIAVPQQHNAISDKYSPSYRYWRFFKLLQQLMQILMHEQKDYDVVLIDGGLLDQICWFQGLAAQGAMDRSESNYLSHVLNSSEIEKMLDVIVSLETNLESLIERHDFSLYRCDANLQRFKQTLNHYQSYQEHHLQNHIGNGSSFIKTPSQKELVADEQYFIFKQIFRKLKSLKQADVPNFDQNGSDNHYNHSHLLHNPLRKASS